MVTEDGVSWRMEFHGGWSFMEDAVSSERDDAVSSERGVSWRMEFH